MRLETLLQVVLPLMVAMGLAATFSFVLVRRVTRDAGREIGISPGLATPPRRMTPRPWWGNPWLWVGVCVLSVVLGVFVWPGLFGGTILFLPFVWIGRGRRAVPVDPRANGHGRSDDVRRSV